MSGVSCGGGTLSMARPQTKMGLTSPAKERWDDVLAHVVPLCGEPRTVEELPGGLTNVNLKVVGPDRVVVVRIAQRGRSLLAIDRDHEHLNSVAAAEAGVGAPVVAYVP